MQEQIFFILFGISIGIVFIEPLLINYIYFSNIDLFLDLILTKKNKIKLINYFNKKEVKNE